MLAGCLDLCLACILRIGEFLLTLCFLFGCKPGLFSVSLSRPSFGFFVLTLAFCVQLRLTSRFVKFPLSSSSLLDVGLFPAALVESFLGQLTVALILLAQKFLNGCQFAIQIFLGFSETHARVLLEQSFRTHAALEVHLGLTTHHNEHQAEGESTTEGNRQNVIRQRHGLSTPNYHLKHAICPPP